MKLLGEHYQPYHGDMVAGMTGTQNRAMDYIRSMLPGKNDTLMTPRLTDNIPGTGHGGGTLQDYMDPYVGAALEPALRNIREQTATNLQGDDTQAQFAGGFRDTGHALERSRDKALGTQAIGDTTATGYSNAFNTAMANRNLDINRLLQNRQDSMALADQLFGYGSKQQATNQAEKTARYSEFLRKIGFDTNQLKDIASIIGSLQSGQMTQSPSTASSILGGISGLGSLFF